MSKERKQPVLRAYEAEMRYLREAGREFAQACPEAAQHLGLTQVGGPIDQVEQVFQGFAFLMGRLRQKLDDALPEITEPLSYALWPHMMRTLPSLAMLEFVPRAGQPTDVLPAGLAVRSQPVGPERTVCVYRTTQPVRVLPLKLRAAGAQIRPDGRNVLRLVFDLLRFDQRTLGDLSRIRLYLHGERVVTQALYLALTREVDSIEMRLPTLHDGRAQPQPRMKLEAAGFGPETRLWPEDDALHDPQRRAELDGDHGLLEYFAFPEKYHFIDLCGFDAACLPPGETQVEFEIVLRRRLASEATFDESNVRLHCTPVINLFELDAMPIQTHPHQDGYRLATPPAAGAHIEPYAVVSVVAIDHLTARKHPYLPFSTFQHRGGMLWHDVPERYFHTRNVWGVAGDRELWLMLGGQAWDEPGSMPDDHLTVRVMACNGRLPRMTLRETSLTEAVSSLPAIQALRNLTQPTVSLYPPDSERRYQWQVIAQFAVNNLLLLDRQILCETLALYNWSESEQNQRRIKAITNLRQRQLSRIIKNGLERRVEIEVTLDPGGFTGPGDIALFGEVLNRFVERYTGVNYGVQLVLIVDEQRTEYPIIVSNKLPL
jgi:type VI secretion system protein ImpG